MDGQCEFYVSNKYVQNSSNFGESSSAGCGFAFISIDLLNGLTVLVLIISLVNNRCRLKI